MDCHGDLDQPRDSAAAFGVADHGLDRADRAVCRGTSTSSNTRLSDSTSARSPATVPVPWASMRPGRGQSPPRERPFEARTWPSGRGTVQSLVAPVAGRADRLDHGVNPVAVSLGVQPPFENQGCDALADHDPVGASSSKVWQRPWGDRAWVLLKHRYARGL